ncbi:MAG: DNA gyrase inhibitor YacG [Pseudomonadota bacterium]
MTSSDNRKGAAGAPATGLCPVCGAPAAAPYAPFCSKRCADVDLHRWLTGGYAIPAVESEDDGDFDADLEADLEADGEDDL